MFRNRWFWITLCFGVINLGGLGLLYHKLEALKQASPETLKPVLTLEYLRPKGVTFPTAEVSGRFTMPMAEIMDREKPIPAALISIRPEVKGDFFWRDDRSFYFVAKEKLKPCTRYSLNLSRELRSLSGVSLQKDIRKEFWTPALEVKGVKQYDLDRNGKFVVSLRFSEAVPREALRKKLTVQQGGKQLEYHLWTVGSQDYRFSVSPAELTAPVTVTVAKGLQAREGLFGLTADFKKTLTIQGKMQIGSGDNHRITNGINELRIRCNQQVDLARAKDFIKVKPHVDFTVAYFWGGMRLKGAFRPATSYEVKLLKGLPANNGLKLLLDAKLSIRTSDLSPFLSFDTTGVYMLAKGNQVIRLKTGNVRKIKLNVIKLYTNNVLHYLRERDGYMDDDMGVELLKKDLGLAYRKNRVVNTDLDLAALLGKAPTPGAYLIQAHDSSYRWRNSTRVVMISDIGMHVRQLPNETLVWVNSLQSAKPLAGTEVELYSRANQVIGKGTVGKEGLVRIKQNPGDKAFMVLAKNGDDIGFLKLEKGRLDLTGLDTGGRAYVRDGYESFVYTDRGIYRPGEKVEFQVLVRNADLRAPKPFPVTLDVTRPDGKRFCRKAARLDRFGTVGFAISLPKHARTGSYRASLCTPGGKACGTVRFAVEDFMPDRMKVSVDTPKDGISSDKEFEIAVKGQHYFGAPASNRKVYLRGTYLDAPVRFDSFKDYRFGTLKPRFTEHKVNLGDGKLDEQGVAAFKASIPNGLRTGRQLELRLFASVSELGGRAVTARGTIRANADYFIGVRTIGKRNARTVQCVLVDQEGKLLKNRGVLTAKLKKVTWNYRCEYHDGYWRYVSDRQTVALSSVQIPVSDGKGSASMKLETEGSFEIHVSDAEGKIVTEVELDNWRWGQRSGRPDSVEITADKKSYNAGDVAKLTLSLPFPGRVLVTVENSGLIESRVIKAKNRSCKLQVPIGSDWIHNAYVSATVIRGYAGKQETSISRAQGVIPLKLDNAARKLITQLKLAKELRPNRDAKVELQVLGADGKPCPAAVTIAAVDEGILSLTKFRTPDPLKFFTTKRRLGSGAMDIYSLLMPEIERPKIGKDSVVGGGGPVPCVASERQLANPIVVKRIESVAIFKRNIMTDANGIAKVTFALPQFNGSLRFMAVAASETGFGSCAQNAVVREPLMIKASLPRFLAPGDLFTVPVSVFNHSGLSGKVSVRVTVVNAVIDGASQQMVELEDGKESELSFKMAAPAFPGVVRINLNARLGEHVTNRTVKIPVRPASSLEIVSTLTKIEAASSKTIELDTNLIPDTLKGSLVLSTNPMLELGDSLDYLIRYPYGCLEQTTSGTFPMLYLSDLCGMMDPKKFSSKRIRVRVQGGINRVLSMQRGDGSFSLWHGMYSAYPWGTVYAVHMLQEAKKAGYEVDPDSLRMAQNHLREMLSYDHAQNATKAYACYVLARGKKSARSWTLRLYEGRDKLPLYSRFQLASALDLIGEREIALRLVDIDALPEYGDKRDMGGLLHSDERQDAILLSVLLDLDAKPEIRDDLAKRLRDRMKSKRYYSTQSNAFALLALGRYTRRFAVKSGFTYSVSVDGQPATTHKAADVFHLAIGPGRTPNVQVKSSAGGQVFARLVVSGVSKHPNTSSYDKGFRARRRFLSRSGKVLDPTKLKQGQLVVVELSLEAKMRIPNIVVNDLLPAGLEIENPNLMTREAMSWLREEALEPDRVERRDDRFLIFTTARRGKRSFRYAARVVSAGIFALPAVHAFCMYDEEIESRSGFGQITVSR